MSELAIVGIGNPFRGDDGAGWTVIEKLEKKIHPSIRLMKARGEISELIDILSRFSNIYFIDACKSRDAIGTWRRIDVKSDPLLFDNPQTSTHGLSIKEAIELAKTRGAFPSKLILYAISGENYQMSETLSPEVAKAAAEVAEKILTEEDITKCMKKV